MNASALQLVDVSELPSYPFSGEDILPGNYFLKWEVSRWLTSDMYLHADPEVGYAYLNLIFKSQLSRPIGTIPADPEGQIAFLEGKYDARKWRALLRCDPSPLANWRPYRCDGGKVRLGHPVVIDMIMDQLSRREHAEHRRGDEKLRKRIDRLRSALAERGVSQSIIRNQTLMERMEAWLEENVPGRRDPKAYDRALNAARQEGLLN
jgi:hypothetical protein